MPCYQIKSDILFAETGVFSPREAHARHEILLESFYKKLQIEARVIGELVMNVIIPSAIAYQSKLVENVKGLKGPWAGLKILLMLPKLRYY
jgi:glutamine synthetase